MSLMSDYDRNSEETKKNLKNFGSRIQELRKKNNLTQSELAEKIGLSTNFIGKIGSFLKRIFQKCHHFFCNLVQPSRLNLIRSGFWIRFRLLFHRRKF